MVSREPLPVTVIAATGLEYREARKALPRHVRVVRAGISLRRHSGHVAGIAISCGVAGGLRDDVPTGTVLIPRLVQRPDGSSVPCDADLVEALTASARALGHVPLEDPLLTALRMVYGAERAYYAKQGFAGVDMESGRIIAERFACVRVVLDTPSREISPAWINGMHAAVTPRAWLDLPFLAKNGPPCARLAAGVIAGALYAARS